MDFLNLPGNYLKMSLTKEECEMALGDLSFMGEYIRLSATGNFCLANLSENPGKIGGTEITLGKDGVAELFKDLDYTVKLKAVSPATRVIHQFLGYQNQVNCSAV